MSAGFVDYSLAPVLRGEGRGEGLDRRIRVNTSVVAVALLFVLISCANTYAQPIAPPTEITPQPVRRIFVPADSLDPEARGLLPMPRTEFERRMARFSATTTPQAAPPEAAITAAVYRATLRNDQLVQGTAELTIERRKPGGTKQQPETNAWLILSPCSLAIGIPSWAGLTDSASRTQAVFGQNDKQQLLLGVPRDGVLHLPWSLSGRRDERGRVKFVVDLPAAVRQQLEISVPANLLLTSDNAIVREVSAKSNGSQAGEASETIWQVEVGGGNRLQLFAQPRQTEVQAAPLVLVRETGSYVFTPGQLDLDLSLELDINRAPLREIRVRHDSRLQWTAIRWGEQTLSWTNEKSDNGEPVTVIALPEPLIGTSRLIQLAAVADWSPSPQKWPLPRVTVEGGLWQEGRINIAAPRWLQLDAVAGPGGRLSATTLASDNQGLDLLQFQLERNSAAIDIQPAVGALPVDVASLVSLQVEPKQIVAHCAAELTVGSGQVFSVECEVPRSWVVDSLETVPSEMLEDRTLRPRGNLQVVTLQLRQPLRSNRPVRINARLRHVRVAGAESWGDDMLQPLRFPSAATAQRYVSLQLADASFEPRLLSADGLEFLSPGSAPPKVKALSDVPLGNWLVRLTDTARLPRFQLKPGSALYAADSTLQIQLAPEHVEYRLRIQCEPESSAVSSLLVQLRPAPPRDPEWLLVGDERPLLAERIAAMPGGAEQAMAALYRIELPRARDAAFVVSAQWSETLTAAAAVPLAELPEANSHAAHVEIFGPIDGPFAWRAERLRPLPFPAADGELRARYRYQAGQEAQLTITPLAETARPVAGWISRCDLYSEFAPTGAARHEARYDVTGDNVEVLEVRLGKHARLARATVDGREVLAFSRSSDPRWLSIPLRSSANQASNPSPRVRIEYTTPSTSERAWLTARWSAPIPETRLPVLQSYWQVRLPSNWQPWPSDDAGWESSAAARGGSADSLLDFLWPAAASATLTRDLPTAAEVQIAVYSPVWFGLIALVLAIVSAAAVLRLPAWSPFRLVGMAAVLLGVSLLLAEPWHSFLQAALAGWLTGFALQLFLRPLKVPPQTPQVTSTGFSWPGGHAHSSVARIVLLAVGLGMITADDGRPVQLRAAEPEAKAWRVVIPVDAQQQPTDYVYVSPPLYAALFRAEARSGDQPAWLLRSAQYELRWNSSGEGASELQGYIATFEIESFHEQSTVRLPFLRDQVSLSDPGVKIEGEPASATWSSANDALQVEVAGIGRKRLEIGLALVTPPKDGVLGAAIRIPAVASSRVLVTAPTAADNVVVASARGSEQGARGSGWQVDLGDTDQLAVQWSRAAAEAAPVVEVEQLLLWRLRPSSVVVDGKWQFRPLSGKLREVVLRVDPRFRLLPTGNGASVVRTYTEEGETNLHHFVLDRPMTSDVTLTAQFLLVGSTGIGNLTPPRFEAVADRVTRDWQAAWTAPGLQWNGQPGTLTAAEFLQAWGDAALTPVQAFRSTAEAPRPVLAVIAVQNRLQAQQQIEWTLTPDQTAVRYRLQGAQLPASVNQLRLQLTPQMVVRRVNVSQNDAAITHRWFRHADGLLTIVLDETRAEPWVVEVFADRPHQPGKPATLPVLQTIDIDVPHYECTLRKRAGAAVTLGKLSGWKDVTNAEEPGDAATTDRLIAQLEWSNPRPGSLPGASGVVPAPIPITLAAALSGYSGELLTRILTEDDDWRLEVIAKLNSPGGTFDEIQFSIPRDWEGPFELEPPGRYELELLPGQSRNLLRVQLAEPVANALHLRLTATLSVERELVRLPVVDLIGNHEGLQRFAALPKRGADSPLQWQTAGLQLRADLPADLTNLAASEELVYEAIVDRYRATARPERVRRQTPRIVLAEHQVSWQTDRRIVGQSEFMILPNGAQTLLIQPPAEHELVAAIVNDVPAQLRREPGISGAATLELHSDSWPQWVQVIYRGVLAADETSERWEFSAPRISNVPVERTRWQIVGPAAVHLPVGQPVSLVAPDEALMPFQALVSMAEGAGDSPSGNHAESASTWLALWRRHWDRELQIIAKRPPSAPLAPILAAKLQALANEVADQLNAPLSEEPGQQSPSGPNQLHDAIHEMIVSRPVHEFRFSALNEVATLSVTRPGTRPDGNSSGQWLLACGLFLAAVVTTQFARSASLRDWLIAYPQLVLALFGVAALLIPGYLWVGVLLLMCTLLATVHSPWQQRV